MKLIYCLMILLWPFASIAQTIKPLNIGDTVPDIKITNVYNYPSSTIRLSDLKGKLVILDFWSTWCGACIESFPKMEKIQKEFGDKLQIILINTYQGDSIQRVKPFFEKRKQRTGEKVELPFSLLQSSILEYFPYKYIPHYVWINKDAKVIAITSQTEITRDNISGILNGNIPSMHIKKDILEYNKNYPLFVNDNGGSEGSFLYRSILTGYREGMYGESIRRPDNDADKRIGITLLNVSLPTLLQTAYAFTAYSEYPDNRKINEIPNTEVFKQHLDTLRYKYTYCYDLVIPPSSSQKMCKYMQEDISRYFNIVIKEQIRKTNCYILKKGKATSTSVYKKPEIGEDTSRGVKFFHYGSASKIVEFFNNYLNLPLINETGLSEKIKFDIILPNDVSNSDAMIMTLKSVGFDVIKEPRKLSMMVTTANSK